MKVLGGLLSLAVLGAPLFVIVAVITALCWWIYRDVGDLEGMAIIVKPLGKLIERSEFMAIPLFIGAGAIMTEGGLAKRLVNTACAVIGWAPGGMAIASVVACMFFAAISGSSPVTLIAVGSIMFPAMVKNGYPENFSLGLVMTAGSLGCLIPPAIAILIYAISVQGVGAVNPSEMFMAGLVPAFIIAGGLAVYSIYVGIEVEAAARGESIPAPVKLIKALGWAVALTVGLPFTLWWGYKQGKFDAREAGDALVEGLWALLLPVIVLGGIYGKLYVPSEAGAVALVYSLLVTVFIYRELDFKGVIRVLANGGKLMGMLILIIGLAFSLNEFLVAVEIDRHLKELVQAWDLGPIAFLLLVNLVLIVLGALMDSISATLIFAPMLAPIAVTQYGMDPLHFGVVFVVNMEIGYLMPPVATNLFVAAAVFKKPFGQVARAVVPTLMMTIAALILFMYVPTCSKGLVNFSKGEPIWESFPWDGKPTGGAKVVEGSAAELGNLSVKALEDTAAQQDGGLEKVENELHNVLDDIYEVDDSPAPAVVPGTGSGASLDAGSAGSAAGDDDDEDDDDEGTPDLGGSFLDEYGGDN